MFFICKYVSCYVITHDAITIDIVTLFHINLYRYSVRLSRASSLFCSTNLTANKDSYTLFFSDATHEDSYFKGRLTCDPDVKFSPGTKDIKIRLGTPTNRKPLLKLFPSDALSVTQNGHSLVRSTVYLVSCYLASEVVILELVKSKCLPILLYGLECCNFAQCGSTLVGLHI